MSSGEMTVRGSAWWSSEQYDLRGHGEWSDLLMSC